MTEEARKRAEELASAYQAKRWDLGSFADQEEPFLAGYEAGLNDTNTNSISFEVFRSTIISKGLVSDFTGYGLERYIAELAEKLGIDVPKTEVGCE